MRFDAPPPCTDDPGRWFSENEARREDAKRLCATCPFQEPCRALSETPIEFDDSTYVVRNGIWAGVDRAQAEDTDSLTPKQRQTRDRTKQVEALLVEGHSKYAIAKIMGLGIGSVQHIVRMYLTPEEAA